MAEPQRPIGAAVIAMTTYKNIGLVARPALVLATIPFMASILVALIAVGDPEIGFVKTVFLGFVQLCAEAIFTVALLRHVLQNVPASVHAVQMGRVEWHLVAISVAVGLLMIPISYLSMYAMDLIFMVMDMFEIKSDSIWVAYVFMVIFPIVIIYFALRFLIAGPLILQHGVSCVSALVRSWTMTHRRVGVLAFSLVLVMLPVGAVSEIGTRVEDYLLHGQSKAILAFVSEVQEYIILTALTILSAVVFQELDKPHDSVRTP